VALAAKGNAPAQRFVYEMVREIEQQELAVQGAPETQDPKERTMSERELARRIAWILSGSVPNWNPGVGAKDGDETCPAMGENEEG
jgi:hypothetical protein